MKWHNEYIVGVTWRNRPFTLAMTLKLNEDADAQVILNKMIQLAGEHICQAMQQPQIQLGDLHIYMCTLVKQKLVNDE